jgi:hypothetical protein
VTFSCIYSKDALKLKRFLKQAEKDSLVVSYIDLTNKLSKNDVYQHEPNDSILSSMILLILTDYLSKATRDTKIFYVLSCLEEEVIFNLKEVISDIYSHDFSFILYSDENFESKHFDCVKIINEKT